MPGNAIEYFATLGKQPGPFECNLLEDVLGSGDRNMHPSELWQEAVTDITVVHPNEKLPQGEGWQVVKKSIEGKGLIPPHIAFRRRKDSHRADHITSIMHVLPGQAVPDGYFLIVQSISKQYSAYLNDYLGYLAIKRSSGTALEYLKGQGFVEDIQVVVFLQDEEMPERYTEAGRVVESKTLSSAFASMSNADKVDPTMVSVAYSLRPPVGLCDLSYKSYTLDRYPEADFGEMQLPVNELPTFAFPRGLRTEFTMNNSYPVPKFFTFVFTNATGGHLYAACLRFWEKVAPSDVTDLFESVFGDDKEMTLSDGTNMFAPMVICVVSTNPFYRAMRRYLRQIYSMSLSQCKVPLEFFISSFVGQVPVPLPGGRPFHVSLDAALVSETSRALPSIQFSVPHAYSFPHIDIDFAGPMRCLSIENIMVVFILLLREAKVTFICDSGTILTETMETFRGLLFPLQWSQTFISRLPVALSGLLQAPGGYMVGLHMEQGTDRDKSAYKAKEQQQQQQQQQQQGISAGLSGAFGGKSKKELPVEFEVWQEALVEGTYVVDLSGDGVFRHNGNAIDVMTRSEVATLLDSVPLTPRQRLQRILQVITEAFQMGPEWDADAASHLLEYDSAFDMHRPVVLDHEEEGGSSRKKWRKFPTTEVRDAFMVFMIDVLAEYTEYIVPPPADFSADSFRTFQEMFLEQHYVDDAEPKRRVLLQKLMETQMFCFLLQERNDGLSTALHFFDMCAALLRRLGLNYCSNIGNAHPNAPLQLHAPLHRMLTAYLRLQQMSPEDLNALKPVKVYDADEASPKGKRSMFNSPMSAFGRSAGGTPTSRPQSRPESVTKSADSARDEACISLDIIKSVLYKMDQTDLALGGDNFDDPDAFMSRRYELDESLGWGAALGASVDQGGDSNGEGTSGSRRGLELQDGSFGPLIVPGPLSFAHGEVKRRGSVFSVGSSDNGSVDRNSTSGEATLYQYREGWPRLDMALLNLGKSDHVHRQVRNIASQIAFSQDKVEAEVQLLVRHPVERLSFCFTACLTGTVSFYGGKYAILAQPSASSLSSVSASPKGLAGMGSSFSQGLGLMGTDASLRVDDCFIAEVQPVVSTVLEVYGTIITRLCLRVLAKQRQPLSKKASEQQKREEAGTKVSGSSTGDILQIMGILSHVESLGLLAFLPEDLWRHMLLACSQCGGNFIRRVSQVLYGCVTRFCGHSTNTGALTYGRYVSAIGNVKPKPGNSPTDCEGVVDCFLHLEEMGLTWFLQRSVLEAVDSNMGGGITSPYRAGKAERSPTSSSSSSSYLTNTPTGSSGAKQGRRGTFMMMEMMLSGEGEGSGSPVASAVPEQPTLRSGAAVYSRLRYQPTTSATYVAESLAISIPVASGVHTPPVGLFAAPSPPGCSYSRCAQQHLLPSVGTGIRSALDARLADIHRSAEPVQPKPVSQGQDQGLGQGAGGAMMSPQADPAASQSRSLFPSFSTNGANSIGDADGAGATDDGSSGGTDGARDRVGSLDSADGGGAQARTRSASMLSALRSLSPMSGSSNNSSSPRPVQALTQDTGRTSSTSTGADTGTGTSGGEDLHDSSDDEAYGSMPEGEGLPSQEPGRERRASYTDRLNSFFGFTDGGTEGSGSASGVTSPQKRTRASVVAGVALAAEFSDDEDEDEDDEDDDEEEERVSGGGEEAETEEDGADIPDDSSDAPTIRASHGSSASDGARPRLSSLEHRPVAAVLAESKDEAEEDVRGAGADEEALPDNDLKPKLEPEPEPEPEPEIETETETETKPELVKDREEKEPAVGPAPEAKKESKDTKQLQQQVWQALRQQSPECVVSIGAGAVCDCGRELLEEDFMAMWVGEHRDKKRFRLNVHENSQDIDAAHKVICVGCSRQFAPMLRVTCYQRGGEDEAEALKEAWSETVAHLSPYGLLFKHEQLMSTHGTRCADEEQLHRLSPQVYWVSQFYAARLQLPSGLTAAAAAASSEGEGGGRRSRPGPTTGPVIVGGRQSLLNYRAKNILGVGVGVGDGQEGTPLRLVYPELAEGDLATLASVQAKLDGSTDGIREALLELSKVEGIVHPSKDRPADRATALYKNLLILCHAGNSPLAAPTSDSRDIFAALNGPTTFDLTLYSSLKQAVDPLDFEFMQIEEADLVHALPSRAMMGFRQAYGLLI